MLKLVRCIVSIDDWENIVSSVECVSVGMTVWQMREVSPETSRTAVYRGREYQVHLPSVVVEIVTDDGWLDDIIAKVTQAHEAGRIDGRRIQVFPVEESYRIRDGFMQI